MDNLIKYGWVKNEFNSLYKKKFQRISLLMRIFKSREVEKFEYVSIDEYFIDGSNLYFIGNNEVYSIDLNDDFNSNHSDLDNDYQKIKFVCKYSIDDIFKHELVSIQYKRDNKLNKLLSLASTR